MNHGREIARPESTNANDSFRWKKRQRLHVQLDRARSFAQSLVATHAEAMHPPSSDFETNAWFAQEVLPHESSLRSYLQRAFSSRADIDDVVQESYLRILRAHKTGTIRSSRAFLFTIARNAARDLFRRRVVADALPITENAGLAVLEDGPGVVDLVIHRQELAFLSEAIRELPDRCREVFLLRKIQGLSQREIALRLDITENTVETLVARGVRGCVKHLRRRGVKRHNAC